MHPFTRCALLIPLLLPLNAFAAESTDDLPMSKAPYLAVYRWAAANRNGGAGGNEAYARWIGRPVVWAEDFEPWDHWEHIEGGDWQLGEWAEWKKAIPGRRLILSVPLLPGPWDRSGPKTGPRAGQPVSLAAGARGDYNAHFKKLAENLVRHALADSIIRPGWEFNGGWYTWRAGEDPNAFVGYWRQIVRTMRAVPGTEKLQFCWNPAQAYQQFPAEQAWPGDEWVDIVGVDLYDDSWQQGTYPLTPDMSREEMDRRRKLVWDKVLLNGNHGLIFWRDFALKHNKPFAIPEWGVNKRPDGHGGLDSPFFIEQMHAFITDPANRVHFHCYFDVQAPDGGHQLSPGRSGNEKTEYPEAAARFRELFGRNGR